MSFESPSGAPAPQDGTPPYQGAPPFQGVPQNGAAPQFGAPPPQQYGAAPQFGAQPQFGTAPYPPNAAGPYTGYPVGMPGSRPSAGLPIAVMALAGVYIVLCLVELFALNNRISVANKIINDPTSVTIDQANSADNLVSTLSLIAIVVFLSLIVMLVVWQRSLRSALAPTGQYQQVMKESRYQLFRIIWLLSILLAVVLRGNGNLDTPQDVVSHDHQYMIYFGIRAALGGLLIFLAIRLKRAADNAFTRALSQAGYAAGAPAAPLR